MHQQNSISIPLFVLASLALNAHLVLSFSFHAYGPSHRTNFLSSACIKGEVRNLSPYRAYPKHTAIRSLLNGPSSDSNDSEQLNSQSIEQIHSQNKGSFLNFFENSRQNVSTGEIRVHTKKAYSTSPKPSTFSYDIVSGHLRES